ncbi:MAG: hypothetical protein Kow0069_38720 [Promethearchaeota archaeon]
MVEEFDFPLEKLEAVLYHDPLWEGVAPVERARVEFLGDELMRFEVTDHVQADLVGLVKLPVTFRGSLKFREVEPGVVEFNALDCPEVKTFHGRIRYRSLGPARTKLGVFVDALELDRAFLDKLGGVVKEATLKVKLRQLFRNFQKLVRSGQFERIVKERGGS